MPPTTRRHHLAATAAAVLAATTARPAASQPLFPERAVTLATGFSPGGSTDVAARLLAERLGPALSAVTGIPGARVVVENRPGAAGTVASEWLRRQPRDGHTLMLVESSSHAIAPAALAGGTPYDPVADFAHLAVVGTAPLALVVHPGFARDAAGALARLRGAAPDTLAYASSGSGSIPHLAAEMLALRATGAAGRFTHVGYRSGGEMLASIARGDAVFGVAVLASAAGQIRDGLVRGLAVTSASRFPAFPDLPTLSEAALPGFELTTWNVIVAPKGLPDGIASALNAALRAALSEETLRARLVAAGVAPWDGPNAPADARAFVAREAARMAEVVRAAGVRLER